MQPNRERGLDDRQCTSFLQWALPQLGLRWAGFRKVRRQVCKRLARRIHELGLASSTDYRARLAADPEEWEILDAMCRITISRFYRDKGVFRALSDAVLPRLAAGVGARKRISCWSAGCASGEEVYTLKIVWDEFIQSHHSNAEITILGTDVDEGLLERARIGCFQPGSLKEMPEDLVRRSFEVRDRALCVKNKYRPGVRFTKQDIRKATPAGPFDLVLCRNLVFTYFSEELQRRVLKEIANRLRPNRWLVIGSHETLPDGIEGFYPLPECSSVLKYSRHVER